MATIAGHTAAVRHEQTWEWLRMGGLVSLIASRSVVSTRYNTAHAIGVRFGLRLNVRGGLSLACYVERTGDVYREAEWKIAE